MDAHFVKSAHFAVNGCSDLEGGQINAWEQNWEQRAERSLPKVATFLQTFFHDHDDDDDDADNHGDDGDDGDNDDGDDETLYQ